MKDRSNHEILLMKLKNCRGYEFLDDYVGDFSFAAYSNSEDDMYVFCTFMD